LRGRDYVSANIEYALITQVINTKDFHTLTKLQIDESYFTSPEVREVYRYIRSEYFNPHSHGQVPSAEMVKLRFPSFFFAPAFDSVAILCNHLRRERIKLEVRKISQDLLAIVDKDPMEAISILRTEAAKMASLAEVGEDLPISSAYSTLLDRYEAVAAAHGLLGIPYPWDQLNEETQGMQGSQFIILYGRPKSMKTWVAIKIGVHAYIHSRKRVLFYTREMGPLLVAQRVAATIAGVDYKAFKNGTLQPHIKQNVFTLLKELLDDEKSLSTEGGRPPCFIITSDRSAASGGSGGGGVAWLQSKIRDVKPDLVIVDGMYLMKDDRSGQRTVDWKAIAHISQDLKLTAQDFDIPIIGVTQANRAADKSKGEDLTELAYADAFGQDADAVFRISKKDRIDENNVRRTELYITAPGLREGRFDGIVINGEPATNFDYIRTIVNLDADEDDKSAYAKKPPQQGPGPINNPFKKANFKDPKIPMKIVKDVS
jgi:replicative DNA helicase